MIIRVLTLRLYAPWVHSLKEKRMEIKSLLTRIRNKFNVCALEAAEQDTHQTIVLAIAAMAADSAQADSILSHILNFVEENTQAQVINMEQETR